MPIEVKWRWLAKMEQMDHERRTKKELIRVLGRVQSTLRASQHIEREVYFKVFSLAWAATEYFEIKADLRDELRGEQIYQSKEFTEWREGLKSRSITDLWTMAAFYRDRVSRALEQVIAIIRIGLSKASKESKGYPDIPKSLQVSLHEYAVSAERAKYILFRIERSVGVDPEHDSLRELASKIEAFIASSRGFPNAPVPRDLVANYVEVIRSGKGVTPTANDLEEATGWPAARWRNQFLDPIFVSQLKEALHKRQSRKYSKRPETKKKWQVAEAYVDTLVDKILKRKTKQLHLNKDQGIKGTQSRPDEIDDDVADVMAEDMERGYGRKKSSHETIDDEEQ